MLGTNAQRPPNVTGPGVWPALTCATMVHAGAAGGGCAHAAIEPAATSARIRQARPLEHRVGLVFALRIGRSSTISQWCPESICGSPINVATPSCRPTLVPCFSGAGVPSLLEGRAARSWAPGGRNGQHQLGCY